MKGARIGLLTDFMGRDPIHEPVNRAVEDAVAKMTAMGATVVRVSIPNLAALTGNLSLMTLEFQPAFNRYLASLGPAAPVKTFDEFMARGEFHPSLKEDPGGQPSSGRRPRSTGVSAAAPAARRLAPSGDDRRSPPTRSMRSSTRTSGGSWSRIGEEQAERNGVLSNSTGFPALTFPGGFSAPTADAPVGVPIGIELLGPEWSEPTLLKLAYAFEQGARVRKPPRSTPPLQ